MHLALELGYTVSELEERMTEREFYAWQVYAAKFMLPHRRMELHAAQLSLIMAKTMGNAKHATLKDFLFDRPEEEPEINAVTGGAMLSGFTSVGMYRLGQGRKLKRVK